MNADDEIEVVPLELPMDRATVAWLARLSRVTGDRPGNIVASMLRDIRVDDESAHDGGPGDERPPWATLN